MKPATASKPKSAAAISRKTTAKAGIKPALKGSLSRSGPTGTFTAVKPEAASKRSPRAPISARPKNLVEKKFWGALSSREADTLAEVLGRKQK